jgi:hypothetical protein
MNRAHDCAEYHHSELNTNGLLMFYRYQVRYAPGSQFVSLHASGIIYVILTWLCCATDEPYSSNVQLTTACCAAFKFHCRAAVAGALAAVGACAKGSGGTARRARGSKAQQTALHWRDTGGRWLKWTCSARGSAVRWRGQGWSLLSVHWHVARAEVGWMC